MENPVVQEKLTRLPGWRGRLNKSLMDLAAKPFSWRENDCASGLGCTVVEAITGVDLKAGWPKYRTEQEAIAAMKVLGFDSLAEAVASILPEVSKLQAQVGDLALIKTTGKLGYALGMVNPSTILVANETGLGHCGWEKVVKVFRVGEYEQTTA